MAICYYFNSLLCWSRTAIENVVDLVTREIHPLAKAAKDTASAAEFVFVIMTVCTLAIIYIPKIVEMF